MERSERKRKAQEISESPQFVSETINELTSFLQESDAILRTEISELRDEVGKLKKQLGEKEEERSRLQSQVDFYHIDAIMDRIRMKLFHHGELAILRRAINPQTRLLRTDVRGDRYIFLSESQPKRSKPTASIKATELSPKREDEETATLLGTTASEPVAANNTEENQQEGEDSNGQPEEANVPPQPETFDAQTVQSPQKETTSDAVGEPFTEIDDMNDVPRMDDLPRIGYVA